MCWSCIAIPAAPELRNFNRESQDVQLAKMALAGMGVKRWLLLTVFGIAFVVVGLALFAKDSVVDFFQRLNDVGNAALDWLHVDLSQGALYVPIGATFVLIGLAVIFFSFFQVVRSIIGALWPEGGFKTGDIADKVYQRLTLGEGLHMVVVGGGTGLSTMLRGLKHETSNISAIVTVSDNGGSSGALTASTGILPPGDLRNCMVALADEEPTLARAFNYRFNGEHPEGLRGHSLGNLFIAAMAEINDGNYERAIADASKILAISRASVSFDIGSRYINWRTGRGSVCRRRSADRSQPQEDRARLAPSGKRSAATGRDSRNRVCARDYSWPRFRLYEHHPESLRRRNCRRDRQVEVSEDICLQCDDRGWRD